MLLVGTILMGLADWRRRLGKLSARLIWLGAGVMTEDRSDDPVYKKNVQRLIERNNRSKDTKE
jgi:hypothetical protein